MNRVVGLVFRIEDGKYMLCAYAKNEEVPGRKRGQCDMDVCTSFTSMIIAF